MDFRNSARCSATGGQDKIAKLGLATQKRQDQPNHDFWISFARSSSDAAFESSLNRAIAIRIREYRPANNLHSLDFAHSIALPEKLKQRV
jgi:hypothetical protein